LESQITVRSLKSAYRSKHTAELKESMRLSWDDKGLSKKFLYGWSIQSVVQ
jgi:hypothetical protein